MVVLAVALSRSATRIDSVAQFGGLAESSRAADLLHLPETARALVGFLRMRGIDAYQIRTCTGDSLTYQRVVEGALPAKLSPGSRHLLVEEECLREKGGTLVHGTWWYQDVGDA